MQMPAYFQVDNALFSRHLFEARVEDRELTADSLKLLHDVHQCTLEEINHETLEFTMLLPDQSEAIDVRSLRKILIRQNSLLLK